MARRRIIGALAGIVLTCALSEGASDVALQGSLDTGYYQRSGQVNERHNYLFEVVLHQDGRWQIRVKDSEHRNWVAVSGFDGEAVYRIEHRTRKIIPADSSGNGNVDRAWIAPGGYPYDSPPSEKILWLACASGIYLAALSTNVMPAPWLKSRLNLMSYSFDAEISLLESAPNLPVSVRFTREHNLDLAPQKAIYHPELSFPNSQQVIQSRENQLKEREYWPDHFFTGHYELLNSTNAGGLKVPLSFRWRLFHPAWKRAGGPDNHANLFVGTITNVVLRDLRDFRPEIVATTGVTDRRFRHRAEGKGVDALVYFLSPTDQWKPRSDAGLQEQHRLVVTAARTRRPALEQLSRAFIITVIALAALALPLRRLLRRHAARKTRAPGSRAEPFDDGSLTH